MSSSATAIPARMRGLNRAEICDQNFIEFVNGHPAASAPAPDADAPVLPGSSLTVSAFLELFESQLISRHLDLMARVLRVQNKVFYTIGSSGHEGNAMVARLTRHTDPAFLHYRSGGFMAERFRKLPGMDPVMDSALSFAASAEDPASGGRHKVWGSKPLWVLPQTSTIASHLPKALGTAVAIEQARRLRRPLPVPGDSIAICSFGDASANHATAQTAFNAAQWTAYQKLPAPVLFVCEDNGIGISVKTPPGWIGERFRACRDLDYFFADGLDLARGYGQVAAAVEHCRRTRRPTFLHLQTTRIMGHAGTDFEIEWRSIEELVAVERTDPLLRSAGIALEAGLFTPDSLLAFYESIRTRCFAAAEEADRRPKITTLAEVVRPLAPYTPDAVQAEAGRADFGERRLAVFGSEARLPENQPPRHLAVQINQGLHDLFCKYDDTLLFGEDVAQKGGVYTVTKGLHKAFGSGRVFNTLLDETMILGLAQGYANMGLLPIPEIQYLAYFHNACDQIRGEAASLQFFSNDQYRNPMLVRIAGLGYQRGFGGHFHNDNSFAALRDIPGLVIGCPSRGDDAAMMLRTLAALARVDGRVSIFLEPIALYMTKDLYEAGDGGWLFPYPTPDQALVLGEPRIYEPEATDLLIVSYGNGIPMSLRAAKRLADTQGAKVRVLDLRWLQPLNAEAIAAHARDCARVLIVDEGRRSASVGEGVMTALVEAGLGGKPIARVVGADTYTPLAGAAFLVLPSDEDVFAAAGRLLATD
ncbi:thiamine pyrophosphate-dependent enzyme [Pseudofulvimonas gallinarii]|jgi:2-oxoisovalerate dehydrogenase E1 component|uniref:3-methyl-2-oxobutanoate dehydrogenase (2-methylpropanoyl-transferring) n=1 Tax=Pseudofulvimonas gallinarii TaxID=634155 RepID=A0A4S3L0M8_9GAMM|nr:thiamine pyrophosphate-dependent enzyme [Pseudofulvimonas gallinarii]TCT01394.1 2-oxoisovalerate dehydrogenase E1 component [Pseudofulvimonas gallinarii]THD15146.1 MFS transporter [Pseudofulvimonas gallinarii]